MTEAQISKKAMKKMLCTFISLLLLSLFSSCDKPKESLKPSDIIMGIHNIEYSTHWLTNGQSVQITIDDLKYSTTDPDVKLTSIKIEREGELITTAPYKQHSPINIKVNKWNHGENTIKLIAIFKSNDNVVEKEISTANFTVFDEIPSYDIEGFINDEIKWRASSGETFYKFFEDVSINHIFSINRRIKWVASNGEIFSYIFKPKNPYFYINKDVTNFDAIITKEELHWHSPDGPANLNEGEEFTYPVYLYVDFYVSGVHEGIALSQETTISFSFISNTN